MSEDLEQMVSGYEPEQEQENENVMNENENEENQPLTQNENQNNSIINVTNFTDWFRENASQLPGIFNIPVSVTNVDPDKNLLMSVSTDDNDTERFIYIFRYSNVIPVLDLPGNRMRVFTNDNFQLDCNLDDDRIIKCYGLKTSTICIPCFVYNNNYVPYDKIRIRKIKDSETITIPPIPQPQSDDYQNRISELLNQNCDVESCALRYQQLRKFLNQITTNEDLVKFFNERQSKMYDVNHLLEIDSIMISIFGNE